MFTSQDNGSELPELTNSGSTEGMLFSRACCCAIKDIELGARATCLDGVTAFRTVKASSKRRPIAHVTDG